METKTEIWKPIEGLEGKYEVSNLGRVRSIDRISSNGHKLKGRIRQIQKMSNGYLHITLNCDGKCHNAYLHILVARAFVPNPNHYKEVNHKNEDKTDNRADNLEWCDRQYNINYGTGRKRHFESLYTKKSVIQMTEGGEIVNKFNSIREAARITGIWRSAIRQCCEHLPKYYTAGGFRWEYKDAELDIRKKPERKKPVVQMTLDGHVIAVFDSATDAAHAIGVISSCIKHCCQGKTKTSYGYKWKYKET